MENEAATLARRNGEVESIPVGETGTCPACGCVGPNPGYVQLTVEEIEVAYKSLKMDLWFLSEEGGSRCLRRSFKCRNWKAAIDFINAASEISERQDISHHPELHLTMYRNVDVVLKTHAAGGLTAWDFKLAKALEDIEIDYSPKWLKEHQEAVGTERYSS